jgi:hypothetical protein
VRVRGSRFEDCKLFCIPAAGRRPTSLRAILLPLGSFGGTALAEYFLLPGLS